MKVNREDKILQALLSNFTVVAAAKAAKVSTRVIYDYLNNPEFAERYKAARDDILRGVANRLQSEMSAAVCVLSSIMNNAESKDYDRLTAAVKILDFGIKLTEIRDITERLEQLEAEYDSADSCTL